MSDLWEEGSSLQISLGVINALFSCVGLLVVYVLHGRGHFVLRKGFHMLILGILGFQLVYDVASCFKNHCATPTCESFQTFLAESAGFTTSALADAMSGMALYVVLRRQVLLTRAVVMCLIFVASLGLLVGSFCAAYRSKTDDVYAEHYGQAYRAYTGLRVLEVVLAALACAVLLRELFLPGPDGGGRKQRALQVLVVRVTSWPLSMSTLRMAPLIWLFLYGNNADRSRAAVNALPESEASLYLWQAALTPMSGSVNLVILLAVQPLAWAHFVHFATRVLNGCLSPWMDPLSVPELPREGLLVHKSDRVHASRLRDLPDHDLLHVWLEAPLKTPKATATFRVGEWGDGAALAVQEASAAAATRPAEVMAASAAAAAVVLGAEAVSNPLSAPRAARASLLPGQKPLPPTSPPPTHLLPPAEDSPTEHGGDAGAVGAVLEPHGPDDRVSYSAVYPSFAHGLNDL